MSPTGCAGGKKPAPRKPFTCPPPIPSGVPGVGLLPLYGLTLLFGALVMKVKEANALISLMQWGVSFLMGVFFPIAVFPPLLKAIALLFPPTWMTNGVRSALLGVGYFFGAWYRDLAVLWAFLLVAPLF